MGDPTISFRFDTEDKVSRYRKAADSDKDGVVTQTEVSSGDQQASQARNALNGVTLPGTTGAAGVKVNDKTTAAADVSSGLGQGTGVVSNRSLFPTGSGPNLVQSSEMNTGDASNYTRLRAAGLTEKQLNSGQNIFVHLGQDKDGKDKYGFYSSGYGVGDERTGVVTVGEDGNISSSLGAGWGTASEEQKQVLKNSYEAREKLIKDKFGDKFENYSKFEKTRSQVDDLLARSDIQGSDRTQLADLKKKMDPSNKEFNHSDVTSEATAMLNKHSAKLQEIRRAEAAGKVAEGTNTDTEGNLYTALKTQTDKVNALDDSGKKEFNTEYEKLQDKLKNLGSSNDEKVKAFLNANNYLKTVANGPNKHSLAEVKWQNARFERMMKDPAFKAEVERNKTPSQTPSTSSEPKYKAGDSINDAHSIAKHLGFQGNDPGSYLQSHLEGDTSNGPKGFTYQTIQGDNTKFLLDSNNEQFLYDTQAQTATKLQAVDWSDDVFYSPKEPGSVLLKSATGFELKKNITNLLFNDKNYTFLDSTKE
jgi:hypothetical protein